MLPVTRIQFVWTIRYYALCWAVFIMPKLDANNWETIQIPGKFDQVSNQSPNDEKSNAWLRCWVKVPNSYFAKHERNLFEESVGFHIEALSVHHDIWINGKWVGSNNPTSPISATTENSIQRYKVPPGTLQKGQWNEVAIRLNSVEASNGFKGKAPFLMDYFLECTLEGSWEFSLDPQYTPGTSRLQKPNRAAFDNFIESQRTLGRTRQVPGPRKEPKVSASQIRSEKGLKTELLLHEPTIAQPFHFTFDERGRLWVAQSRQYPYPAGIRMLSRDKYYRSHYDAIPKPPPNHTPGADRITIHEDTNGDGTYDLHKTFVDGLNMANSAIRGYGGVWVMHTPYLLFYPDTDADDTPDGPPEVHLSGFGFEDSHSIANGLVWGPDGWLYGGQGSTCSCRIKRPGIESEDDPGVYFEGCMVWRYHPLSRAFEIFAEGGGNTYGLEFDSHGRLFSGHNGGNTRGWHFVQGGFYQMQGVNPGKFGPPRKPYAFGDLPMMSSPDRIVRFTHLGAFAESSAIPEEYQGMLFSIDPLHNEVIASTCRANGSTFETKDHSVVAKSSDPAFRPVHIANAPDGSLMISDMYEFYIAHGQHYQNQIDPSTGRIYRIQGATMTMESDLDLSQKTPEQWIKILRHPNKWHRHTAVRLLGELKDPKTYPVLRKMVANESGLPSLNALWALYQAQGLDTDTILKALNHADAFMRLWGVRFIGEIYGSHRNLGLVSPHVNERELPESVVKALLQRAMKESDAEVRSQMASTARRLNLYQGLALVEELLKHREDLRDPYIPLLCYWVFEAHMPDSNDFIVNFLIQSQLWEHQIFTNHVLPRITRRLAIENKRGDLMLLGRLMQSADSPEAKTAIKSGFQEAFRGRSISGLPADLMTAFSKSGPESNLIKIRNGDRTAIENSVNAMLKKEAPLDERIAYAQIFGEIRSDQAKQVLLTIMKGDSDVALRKAAFASITSYPESDIAEHIIQLLPGLQKELIHTALTTLISRESWIQLLLAAIETKQINALIIPPEIAENLRQHNDTFISKKARSLLPEGAESMKSMTDMLTYIQSILKQSAGNPYAGEAIYMERCAACHKLFFKGGNIGPDLTSYQRKDLSTLLPSIVDPNAEIREGFQFIQVNTKDGRQLSGFESDRDLQVMVIRMLDAQEIMIPVDEIESVESMNRSMMPEGLLEGLDDQQLRDFFAYLRISQPIKN